MVIIGAILAYSFETILWIIGTSFPGSFAFVYGIDVFVKSGFKEFCQGLLLTKGVSWEGADIYVYGLFFGWIVLAVCGSLFQYRHSEMYHYRDMDGNHRHVKAPTDHEMNQRK